MIPDGSEALVCDQSLRAYRKYQKVNEKAGCSYNKINQTQACQNSKLINGVLKEELGFQGILGFEPSTSIATSNPQRVEWVLMCEDFLVLDAEVAALVSIFSYKGSRGTGEGRGGHTT
ncbi:hypothetical protein DFH07DRAFT_1008476 [Mycena maculata]|uniref:Uncharacterized protein n=1 Tax=Mycena maculata TaxID=230809 RepID=A0AAD7HHA3_9AGAR|nr:hypothetical protein DFH07DRAFT_1008476 [Mycena maculata]